MLIDRRGPFLGSTTATTALVQFEIDTPLTILARSIGRERRSAPRSRLAVDNLRWRIAAIGIDCGLAERRSLYLAGDLSTPAGSPTRRRPGGRPGSTPTSSMRPRCATPTASRATARSRATATWRSIRASWRRACCCGPSRAAPGGARAGAGDAPRPRLGRRGGRDRGRPGDPRRACRARHRLRAGRAGAGRGPRGHLDLGARHPAAAAPPLAGRSDDVGEASAYSLPLTCAPPTTAG